MGIKSSFYFFLLLEHRLLIKQTILADRGCEGLHNICDHHHTCCWDCLLQNLYLWLVVEGTRGFWWIIVNIFFILTLIGRKKAKFLFPWSRTSTATSSTLAMVSSLKILYNSTQNGGKYQKSDRTEGFKVWKCFLEQEHEHLICI